jgi:hypothetical protein
VSSFSLLQALNRGKTSPIGKTAQKLEHSQEDVITGFLGAATKPERRLRVLEP